MLLACALGLLLATSPAGASAPGEGEPTPASASASKAARARQAAALYAARDYARAAREYEALAAETGEPGFQLAAGRSRLAAGHRAHAVAYLGRVLASGLLTATDTQVAHGELEAAQRGVTPVTLRVQLPPDLDHLPALAATHLSPSPTEARPTLEFPLPTGAGPERVLLLQLDPGTWRLQVDDPALAAVQVVLEVRAQPGDALQLDLRPRGPGRGAARPLRLVAALGGLGAVMLAAGVGVTVVGDRRTRRSLTDTPAACLVLPGCRQDLADAVGVRGLGAGLLGAGAGLVVGGLTGLVGEARLRRRLWLAELAVGGVGALGAGVAVGLTARGFSRADAPGGEGVERRGAEHTVAAAGLGLGSGLVVAAALALLRTRIEPRRGLRAVGLDGLGLGLAGRF